MINIAINTVNIKNERSFGYLLVTCHFNETLHKHNNNDNNVWTIWL